jgi:hypothetical protein
VLPGKNRKYEHEPLLYPLTETKTLPSEPSTPTILTVLFVCDSAAIAEKERREQIPITTVTIKNLFITTSFLLHMKQCWE